MIQHKVSFVNLNCNFYPNVTTCINEINRYKLAKKIIGDQKVLNSKNKELPKYHLTILTSI